MIRKLLYIVLVLLGLIPATFTLFGYAILGLYALSAAVSHPEDFKEPIVAAFAIALVFWFISGICGYLGLLSLLRGMQPRWYRINLVLLSLGVLNYILFFVFMGESLGNVFDSIESVLTLFFALLPGIMSSFFITWILIRMNK